MSATASYRTAVGESGAHRHELEDDPCMHSSTGGNCRHPTDQQGEVYETPVIQSD
uniref:Uncharacterized protein n=1 Tax=Anguilla anguilla TaxID=7936 RepID=A0A0E9TI23_ANGAN